MFRSSHDSIIKENINKIMQITAILARRINIRGCEDYENTFARMESDCRLTVGFKALIKSISYMYTKQSNLFLHFLSTSKRFSRLRGIVRACACSVWRWRGIVVYVLLHDYVKRPSHGKLVLANSSWYV